MNDRLGGIMVNALTSSVVDRKFDLGAEHTKTYNIAICCFSAKHMSYRITCDS